MKKQPTILITNDDSVYAKGIAELIEIVRPYGKIVVMAPEVSHSAQSHAVTVKNPLRFKKIKEEDNLTVYSCTGTTADCVKMALHQVLDDKPDFLFSGINHGTNSSTSVFYSGTMAGAIEGCLNDIPSAGFSLAEFSDNPDFSPVKKYVRKIVANMLANRLPHNVCLNVNFPSNKSKIQGTKICRQADAVWIEEFHKRVDPNGGIYYWLGGTFFNREPEAQDTDEWALANGYVSIVPVHVDLTHYETINTLKKQNYER